MTQFTTLYPEDLKMFPHAAPCFIYSALRSMEKSFGAPFQGTEDGLYKTIFLKDAPEVVIDRQKFSNILNALIENKLLYKYPANCPDLYFFSVNPPENHVKEQISEDELEYIKTLRSSGITAEQLKSLLAIIAK